jgi:hypothetical protein
LTGRVGQSAAKAPRENGRQGGSAGRPVQRRASPISYEVSAFYGLNAPKGSPPEVIGTGQTPPLDAAHIIIGDRLTLRSSNFSRNR